MGEPWTTCSMAASLDSPISIPKRGICLNAEGLLKAESVNTQLGRAKWRYISSIGIPRTGKNSKL